MQHLDLDRVLVVSHSGRSIAQSLAKADIAIHVADCFADLDTRACAEAVHVVGTAEGQFDHSLLTAAVARAAKAGCQGIVYGSGFENAPDLLAVLGRMLPLFGNRPELVRGVGDPAEFFPTLDMLGIRHPEVRSSPPDNAEGWLIKASGATGGGHVRTMLRGMRGEPGDYFQRKVAGRPMSVSVISSGRFATALGISECWTAGDGSYRYGGAVSGVRLSASLSQRLVAVATRLISRFGLVGINTVDVMADGENFHVLEVNPRPGATAELYDQGASRSLMLQHIQSVQGAPIPGLLVDARAARAHCIVYAPYGLRVPLQWDWPEWCRDRPSPGTWIPERAPVCSVVSVGKDANQARSRVRGLHDRILQSLMTAQTAA